MKAKLIKTIDGYHLRSLIKDIPRSINVYHKISETEGEFGFGEHSGKLSKQNCEEEFAKATGVVDVEQLAEENTHDCDTSGCYPADYFIAGFNKAMELNKDKVFTEDDVNLAFVLGKNKDESRVNKLINSRLQPTEMEVMIVMEEISSTYLVTIGEVKTTRLEPKLNSEGCLILKRVV
jgi:hypothetical protein